MAVLILAGCGGGGGQKSQVVRGPGFRFAAPVGWKVTHAAGRAKASSGSELVQVSTFKLLKPYSDALFGKVTVELRARMAAVAHETHGAVAGSSTVRAAGIRSHSYEVDERGHVDHYTFVLRDSREYELLCRRRSSSSNAFCDRLVRSFATA